MSKRFELHLEGMDAPEGLIDADRLVEIVKSLQAIATRLGRIETDSAQRGRPSKNLDRVASLRIGLEKGSTTIIAERDVAQGAFEIGLPDEEAVDLRLAELIQSVGADQRPDWVTDSLARAAGDLVAALQRSAPRIELKVDGISRTTFDTRAIHRETWTASTPASPEEEVTFTGRLFAVISTRTACRCRTMSATRRGRIQDLALRPLRCSARPPLRRVSWARWHSSWRTHREESRPACRTW